MESISNRKVLWNWTVYSSRWSHLARDLPLEFPVLEKTSRVWSTVSLRLSLVLIKSVSDRVILLERSLYWSGSSIEAVLLLKLPFERDRAEIPKKKNKLHKIRDKLTFLFDRKSWASQDLAEFKLFNDFLVTVWKLFDETVASRSWARVFPNSSQSLVEI